MPEAMHLRANDILSKRWLTLLVWRAPILLVAIGAFTGTSARTALWTSALTISRA